ncbi:EAL domain-containing protein [Tumidithrix elongata RA019]|uniref:EAL domain-containing protein n=1 Tax=Tumidithrix elongata BACA0141 TaxID=2716417 RepID=A0AAW9PS64_9CYAN|nr:EAL domain-containing protein [Tumidithrix elongata RA019]
MSTNQNSTFEIPKENEACILIVDDTPYNCQLLSTMLSRQGYKVLKAENGERALALVDREIPDLILLDIRMPDLSGIEVCIRLKDNPTTADVPVIFISAIDEESDKVEAFSVGGIDYINKPFHLAEVLARVQTHLKVRSLQSQLQEQAMLLKLQNISLQKELSTLLGVDKSLHEDLQLALEKEQLQLYYQPILDLDTKVIRGFEALIRWQHPERGFISPLNFIPLAEATGLIDPIGKWVIHQACSQLYLWTHQFSDASALTISVNVSTKQLANPDLIDHVQKVLQETKIAPNTLKLEITESSVMSDPDHAMHILSKLQDLGVQFYMDDFGTGYSSLRRLNDFPIDVLKIDQSFIKQEEWVVVNAILMLAFALDKEVIIEGIETEDQLKALKTMGCRHGQGYLFSRPLDIEGATKLLAKQFDKE